MVFPFFRAGPPPRLRGSHTSAAGTTGNFARPISSRSWDRYLRRRDALRPGRSPLLKTFTAIYRASLCWLERNRRFFSALRAYRLGFDTLYAAGTSRCARRAVGFARLAPLGLVLEALVGEKHLLAGGEYELSRTFCALQNPIVVFHTLLHGLAGTGVAAEQSSQPMRERARKSHVALIPAGSNCLNGPRLHGRLVLLTPLLFPETLTREGLFGTPPFTRFHVVAVLFNLFDYVFRLHFSLEASERIL